MRTAILGIGLAVVVGCSTSSDSGDPQNGNATIVFGGKSSKLVDGSAIADASMPGNMVIQLGTAAVTCSTNLDSSEAPPHGEFAYFSVDASGPGVYSQVTIGIISSTGSDIGVDVGTGSAEVDTVGARVTGDITYEPGGNAATGSFDVEKCF